MRYAFLIPFRTDNGTRQKICDWVVERIEFFFPDANVYIGSSPSGEFNRSAAINDAWAQTCGEEFLVITDADTIWSPTLITGGLFSLVHDGRIVLPYKTYRALDTPSTERILNSPVHLSLDSSGYDYEFVVEANNDVYYAPPVSGLAMIRNVDFELIGGFDDRFVGWGEEDLAFVIAAKSALGKPVRNQGDVYHLSHPKGLEYAQPHYEANKRLLRKEYL